MDEKNPTYEVFGGRLRSELDFPELPLAAEGSPSWDLRMRSGPAKPVAGELVGRVDVDNRVTVELRRYDAGWRLAYSDTGIFEINPDGSHLDWYPGPDHDLSAARVDVLGRVLAVALHAQGILCLHGSAVAFEHGTVAFLAPKFHGKSTTALALARSGAKLVTDDCLPVELSDPPRARPGVHAVRLWRDSVDEVGHEGPLDTGPGGKFLLTDLPVDRLMRAPTRLAALYFLTPVTDANDRTPAVERVPVHGLDASLSLLGQTKIGALLGGSEAGTLLQMASRVAELVPVYRLRVVRDFNRLDEVIEGIRALHGDLLEDPVPALSSVSAHQGPGA